jgi:hypothetical protein
MRLDNSEKLFGTGEFETLKNKTQEIEINDTKEIKCNNKNTIEIKIVDENNIENNCDDFDQINHPTIEIINSKNKNKPKFPKFMVVSSLIILIVFTLIISLTTLYVKAKTKSLSYQLSAQRNLFKRLSQKRALYELEYAFFRSKKIMQEKIIETDWKEIVPLDTSIIKVKKRKQNRGSRSKNHNKKYQIPKWKIE